MSKFFRHFLCLFVSLVLIVSFFSVITYADELTTEQNDEAEESRDVASDFSVLIFQATNTSPYTFQVYLHASNSENAIKGIKANVKIYKNNSVNSNPFYTKNYSNTSLPASTNQYVLIGTFTRTSLPDNNRYYVKANNISVYKLGEGWESISNYNSWVYIN